MQSISIDEVKLILEADKKNIDSIWKDSISKLKKLKQKRSIKDDQRIFLQKVIEYFENHNLLIAPPKDLQKAKRKLKMAPKSLKTTKGGSTSITHHILEALNYEGLRTTYYPKYFQKVGIKSCVYCNSQLTVSIDKYESLKTKIKHTVKAKFQVDHYHNKNDYPYLSISFFNLYPSCGPCNNVKSRINVRFELYTQNPQKSAYNFHISNHSLNSFLLKKNMNDLKIEFFDPEKPKKDIKVKGSFQDTFDIEGIYMTQLDLAEEMIIKSRIYTGTYKKGLITRFSGLLSSTSLTNRVLYGNYMDEKDIHKRPMSKFTQDIARQLKLIR